MEKQIETCYKIAAGGKKTMFVIKRNGTQAKVHFDEILSRIESLCNYPSPLADVDTAMLAKEVIGVLECGMQTRVIDILTAEKSASHCLKSLDYETLASRLLVSNHHKNTADQVFSAAMAKLSPMLADDFSAFVKAHAAELDAMVNYERDYLLDYFGFATLYEQRYLLRDNDQVVERPQDLFLRVAVFIHMKSPNDLALIQESYNLMSTKQCIHASPTLFNSGLKLASCISCFLGGTDDSRQGIQRIASAVTDASAACGGVAFSATRWRPNGSLIQKSGGRTNGIVPFIQWCQAGVSSFNQGSRRKGSLAVYLDVYHPDLYDFLEMRKHGGDETKRCREVFLGLWIPDIFFQRVEQNGIWSFFDTQKHADLLDLYGDEFTARYCELEKEGEFKAQVRAREVWVRIFQLKRETGLPYLMSKDNVNRRNNQENIGMIYNSNLCTEIVEHCADLDAAPEDAEMACCTLASIGLPSFVQDAVGESDEYPKVPFLNVLELTNVTRTLVRNLDKIIDRTYYYHPNMERSNLRHRPMGIGVQGLADVFHKYRIAFDSEEARTLNRRIAETIYFAALSESNEIARERYLELQEANPGIDTRAGAYSSYLQGQGAPLSRGIFNFEMYGISTLNLDHRWEELRERIQQYGVRHSLLVAYMPTASTAQIFRNSEGFEPLLSNVFLRKVMKGEYYVINRYLFQELRARGLWTPDIVEHLKINQGSLKGYAPLEETDIPARFKTVWETETRALIQLAADRQPFVDQSQSMNLYIEDLDLNKFSATHFMAWKSGLKTLSYYLHSRVAVRPMQTTLEVKNAPAPTPTSPEPLFCKILDNGCTVCGT